MTDTPSHPVPAPQEMPPAAAPGEPAKLIASDRVEGTAVYDPSGNKLGAIETLMIDKVEGRVEYAVLSFGGFLGFNTSHYPLPWHRLRYDTGLGGYVVDVTEAQLAAAPSYPQGEPVDWSDQGWGETLRGYYGPSPYGSRDGL
ncbi:PRC-barrel domain-containing protein [Pseudoroseomonas cervicalis]|uniref:PRC-barrel domain-containing protein n=1 Tax=Teichococcus cervicalis TaxID=204525 RepID=UPI0022F1C5D3|nr:PRC-barrel domain-containing protein [Pseudoroseomonas cervicalis]WBV41934.1 PRC-barrel domain-containing protein [Pseudoroseomonas cervicalis]